jgi:hypothetical protein
MAPVFRKRLITAMQQMQPLFCEHIFCQHLRIGMLKKRRQKRQAESESLSALIPSNPFSSFIIFTPLLL